jgi:hypothetical protein
MVSILAFDLRTLLWPTCEYRSVLKGSGGRGSWGAIEKLLAMLSERPNVGLSIAVSRPPFLIRMLSRAGIEITIVAGVSFDRRNASGNGHWIDTGLDHSRSWRIFSGVSRGVMMVGSSATSGDLSSGGSVNSVMADNGDNGIEF